jgi:cyclophilin family peptidyl-prolyl cis-trans isomerase
LPIHLLIPDLRRVAAALLLWPLAVSAQEGKLPDGLYAQIETPKGTITCELAFAKAPLTVANFVGLAEGTLGPAPRRPFFDGLTFHRVVPGFVIQGGDPLATGEGGPGYTFPDEFGPGLGHDSTGVLSMANEGPDTNGSQFFITLAPVERLNFLHAVFGRTVGGADVLPRITQGDVMHVRIIRRGAAALAFKANDAAFAALAARTPRYAAEKEPGPKAHFDDPDKVLPTDPPRAANFNFKLGNVERATGLRVYCRLFAKFVAGASGTSPDARADGLSQSLGLADNGVLAVYFADQDKWILRVGKSTAARFVLPSKKNGTTTEVVPLADAVNILLAKARSREARYDALGVASLPNFLQIPGQKIKVSVDAVLDELLLKLTSQE